MSTRTVYEPTNADYLQESLDYLRRLFPVDSEVRTVVRHVSRSGMMRSISVLAIDDDDDRTPDRIVDVSQHVARVLGWRLHDTHGIVVNGCGMDMCFHLVYSLARALYADTAVEPERAGYLLTSRPL